MPAQNEAVINFKCVRGVGCVGIHAHDVGDEGVQTVVRQLAELALRCEARLVVDATDVHPMTCTWFNALIDLHDRCRRSGGGLVLAGLSAEAEAVVRATGLSSVITLARGPGEGVTLLQAQVGGHRPGILERLGLRRPSAA